MSWPIDATRRRTQVDTRVWLIELSRVLGRRATLDDIPDAHLARLAERGLDVFEAATP